MGNWNVSSILHRSQMWGQSLLNVPGQGHACMEQNLGPHMEQKWAVLAGSWGSVASWNNLAVTGSRDRLNWSYLHMPPQVKALSLTVSGSHMVRLGMAPCAG